MRTNSCKTVFNETGRECDAQLRNVPTIGKTKTSSDKITKSVDHANIQKKCSIESNGNLKKSAIGKNKNNNEAITQVKKKNKSSQTPVIQHEPDEQLTKKYKASKGKNTKSNHNKGMFYLHIYPLLYFCQQSFN